MLCSFLTVHVLQLHVSIILSACCNLVVSLSLSLSLSFFLYFSLSLPTLSFFKEQPATRNIFFNPTNYLWFKSVRYFIRGMLSVKCFAFQTSTKVDKVGFNKSVL